MILWITPALVLLAALGVTLPRIRAQKKTPVAALSDAERAALDRIVAADKKSEAPITKA